MNCRPGDLARIVCGPNRDGICRVVRPTISIFFEPTWEVVALTRMCHIFTGEQCSPGDVGSIEDYRLRPIRDPGEEARDESLDWLEVPTTTKETA